jgi:hypothetical protein
VALLAAALDPRIEFVYLDGGLVSWQSLLETDEPTYPLAAIPPGILASTDLPEVAAAVAPRPVFLAGPVDGAGRPLPIEEAQALHRHLSHVHVVSERGWDRAALEAVLDRAARPNDDGPW